MNKNVQFVKVIMTLALFVVFKNVFSQESNKKLHLGKSQDYVKQFNLASAVSRTEKKTNTLELTVGEGKKLSVDFKKKTEKDGSITYSGSVADESNSSFVIRSSTKGFRGHVLLKDKKIGYVYQLGKNDSLFIKEEPAERILCIEYSDLPVKSVPITATGTASISGAYKLESFPGAQAVMYLDFDGQYVLSPYWNSGQPINALPSGMDDASVIETWEMISEDFRPFNVNITTNEAVYLAAPANRRMRCIFTPTTTASPGAGGVAYIGSFNWGDDTPCWVFNYGAKYAGEAGSHELGHTLGLFHDGRIVPSEGYYYGQGEWAPIMGVAYYEPIGQFSKGEYTSANNFQDDLSIIANDYGLGYRTDDYGNGLESAFKISPINNNTLSVTGLIETTQDVDVFAFQSTGGLFTLTINPALRHTNLNIKAVIRNAAYQEFASFDPASTGAINIAMSLSAGLYFLSVEGVGEGDPLLTGYSDYGSLGVYSLFAKGNFTTVCMPTINIASNLFEICNGSSTNINATSTTLNLSFNWAPSAGLSNTLGSSVVARPTTTTVYTVTGTSANCPNAGVNFVKVVVNPIPDVTISPIDISICRGNNANFMAYGADTYNWVSGPNMTFSTGPVQIANPINTFTYTVIGTNAKGCSKSAVAKVNVNTSCGISVWFKKPSSALAPRIHFWNVTPNQAATAWPGIVMTQDAAKGPDWFKFTIGNNAYVANMLFHDGANYKSPDQLMVTGGCFDGNINQWINCNVDAPPTLTIAPRGGNYTSLVGVTLSASDDKDPNPLIYYTLDGTTPTTFSSSIVKSGTININSNTNLKAFTRDSNGNLSQISTETYVFPTPPVSAAVNVWFKKPASIQAPRIHYWNVAPTQAGSVWPGVLMTQDLTKGTDWYKFTITNATTTSLLFHDNAAYKTVDMLNIKGGCFDGNLNQWVNCNTSSVTVWFKKPASMQAPRIHFWNVSPTQAGSVWPGILMTQDLSKGTDWYKYTFANATVTSLLFHDNAAYKTNDLLNITGGCFDGNTRTWVSCTSARLETTQLPTDLSNDWSLFPNPATESFTLEYTRDSNATLELKIINVFGELVFTETLEANKGVQSKTFHTGNFNSGVYVVSVNDGSSITFKKLSIK